MKQLIELDNIAAKHYLLKQESYFNVDLPQYFTFQNLLNDVSLKLNGHRLSDFYGSANNATGQLKPTYPSDFENVNYTFLNNKDGKFAWRPFQLIHPALYVSLVHNITEEANWNAIVARFEQFAETPKLNVTVFH